MAKKNEAAATVRVRLVKGLRGVQARLAGTGGRLDVIQTHDAYSSTRTR